MTGMVLKKEFWSQPAGSLRPDMTDITSCGNVIGIRHTSSAVLVVLWLVSLLRERENFIRLFS